MRKLLSLVLLVLLAWSGYWFGTATLASRAAEDWRLKRLAEGWKANWTGPETNGFPASFSSVVKDIDVKDTSGLFGWKAAEVQIDVPSYWPTAANAVWPKNMEILLGGETVTVAADRLETGLGLAPNASLTLNELTVVADDLVLDGRGWTAVLGQGRLSTRQTSGLDYAHDMLLYLRDLAPPAAILRLIDPAGQQPLYLDELRTTVTAAFDAPLDRTALKNGPPALTMLEITEFETGWGDIGLEANGQVKFDAQGVPDGRIEIRVENWLAAFEIAKALGVVRPELEQTILRTLEALASVSGTPGDIDAPLSFQKGFMSFGPIPLGPAPRVAPRQRQ